MRSAHVGCKICYTWRVLWNLPTNGSLHTANSVLTTYHVLLIHGCDALLIINLLKSNYSLKNKNQFLLINSNSDLHPQP